MFLRLETLSDVCFFTCVCIVCLWSLVFGKPAVFLDEVLDVKGSDIQHEYNTTRRSNMQ